MSKARTLADFISDGSEFADGTISVAEVSGAAPLASPSFTGATSIASGSLSVTGTTGIALGDATPATFGSGVPTVVFQGTAANGRGGAINFREYAASGDGAITSQIYSTDGADGYGFVLNAEQGSIKLNAGGLTATKLEVTTSGVVINETGADNDFRVESDNKAHMLFVDAGKDQVSIGNSSWDSDATSSVAQLLVDTGIHTEYFGTIALSYFPTNYDQYYKGLSGKQLANNIARGLHIFNFDNDSPAGIQFWPKNKPGDTSPERGGYMGIYRNFIWEGSATFNENGGDYDFRVESSGTANMLQVDAGTNVVNINSNNTAHDTATKLQVAGRVRFGSGYGAETAGMTTPSTTMILTKESFSPTSGATRIYGLAAQNSGYAVSGSTAPMGVLLGGWNNGSSRAGGIEYDPSTYNLHIMAGATGAGQTGFQDTGRVASFNSSSIVFNDQGNNQDFRVESDGNQYALFVDADQDTTHIGGQGGNYVANVYSNTVNSPSGAMLINAALNNSGEGLFIDAATRSINEETQRIFRTRDRQSYNIQTTLVGGDTIFNDDGASWQDFTVESDGNANMLKVDGASNAVRVGTGSTSYSNVSNISFEAVDMAVIGNGWISGYVAGTSNNNSGFILIHDFTSLSAGSYGGAWHGKVIINSYTGSAYVDFSYIKRYNSADQNTIAFSVRDSTGGMSGVSTVNLQLVVCTYDGRKYIAIKKNGGGTGTTYLQGMGQFGNNSAKLLEVTSVTSVDRTIGTLI